MQVGGAPTQRISKRNSTNNVSWGGAPTKRNWIPNFNRQCNLSMTNQRYSFSFTSPIQWKYACWYLNIYIQTIFIAISINLKFAIKNCQHANRAADSIPLISPLNIEWKPLWKYQYISDTYLFQYIHRFDVPLMDYLVQKWLNQHCPYYLLRN